jgi:hypothetical protein
MRKLTQSNPIAKLALIFAVVSLFSFSTAQASLQNRSLSGPGLDSDPATFEAVYDTDLDITWLANANYAKTSGYASGGFMTWYQATAWANNLDYGGYNDWRLPNGQSGCPSGYNCTDNEMGHLFYLELGGEATKSIETIHNANYNLFTNIQGQDTGYWTSQKFGDGYVIDGAWVFGFASGSFVADPFTFTQRYAWAVRSGDVSAVPIPAAVWLFASALTGLGLIRGLNNKGLS